MHTYIDWLGLMMKVNAMQWIKTAAMLQTKVVGFRCTLGGACHIRKGSAKHEEGGASSHAQQHGKGWYGYLCSSYSTYTMSSNRSDLLRYFHSSRAIAVSHIVG